MYNGTLSKQNVWGFGHALHRAVEKGRNDGETGQNVQLAGVWIISSYYIPEDAVLRHDVTWLSDQSAMWKVEITQPRDSASSISGPPGGILHLLRRTGSAFTPSSDFHCHAILDCHAVATPYEAPTWEKGQLV